MKSRLTFALALGTASIPLVYAIVRIIAHVVFPRPSPTVIIWETHSAFLWTFVVSAYVGGMVAFAGFAMTARGTARAARWLGWLVVASCLIGVAQGTLLP